jgi:hypothetical protein
VYLPFRTAQRPSLGSPTDTVEDEVKKEIKALKGLVLNRWGISYLIFGIFVNGLLGVRLWHPFLDHHRGLALVMLYPE